MTTTIIHSNTLNFEQSKVLERSLGKLQKHNNHYRAFPEQTPSTEKLRELREQTELDINILPENFQSDRIGLMISDMDSTLIAIECIDEIADFIQVKPQVSAITEAAMRGELNFEESLTQRVALLKGLEYDALQRVYDERLTLNPGAEQWIKGLKKQQIKFALVSGGFTFFTDRLKERLNIDFARANVLAEEDDKLSGSVVGSIVGAQAKADFLQELCDTLQIDLAQTVAVGDGANDLLMMKKAGLSVAYHAKPAVQAEADCALNYRGLDAILDFID
ncbi:MULTISPECIES: phosphoserine phosphatase SerB [Thiomicrorhabdus]|uniref:Phosphoserine phosphatase n=1 Tax=Thiomicrorhabdus heinhorstiae TaxID=2748010 RepID=A0ABS0BWF3_9GAMM|nr:MULTISPECIES: phosphoserine phosphatase SerB [Thiomicrorhabdus]MBF6057141.1 phosphoserine phosphatase SerB [Thiomicrorhabdus heinhorstiae]